MGKNGFSSIVVHHCWAVGSGCGPWTIYLCKMQLHLQTPIIQMETATYTNETFSKYLFQYQSTYIGCMDYILQWQKQVGEL